MSIRYGNTPRLVVLRSVDIYAAKRVILVIEVIVQKKPWVVIQSHFHGPFLTPQNGPDNSINTIWKTLD